MRKLLLVACFFVVACHKPKPTEPPPTPSVQEKRAERAAAVAEPIQRQWTFLNQIRQEDAFSSSIHRTLLNDENQLGVVLYSSVKPETAPELMRQLMTKMAREFPGEEAAVTVYTSGTPPRKLGVAHLDGKTEEPTYTPL